MTVWTKETIYQYQRKRASPDQEKIITNKIIDLWITEAEKKETSGLLKLHHYQHAIEISRNFGLSEVANNIRVKIQELQKTDLQSSRNQHTSQNSKRGD